MPVPRANRPRILALLLQRCPRCFEGKIFSGFVTMHDRCPWCGLVFEREHGYFTGAMVAAYVIGVPLLALLTVTIRLFTRWQLEWVLLTSDLVFLSFVPWIFRMSRVLWIHLDRKLDPS